jgi:virginiamycin A acetyltransferase
MIEIHPTAYVSPLADIEESVKGSKIVIGPNSYVDSFVKIKAAGGTGDFVIGSNSFINVGCARYIGNGIVIGNNVSIAASCVLSSTNQEYRDRYRLHQQQGFMPSRGGIRIGDDVRVGASSGLLDGPILKAGCAVGSCSIVLGAIDAYGAYAGNPLVKRGERIEN